MRKTKIVATIGPASKSEGTLKEMIDNGMDIARQNFSHGTHEQHKKIFENIRSLSDEIGVMVDTQGPEIRLRQVEEGTALENGREVELVVDDIIGDKRRLSVDYPNIIDYLEKGDTVLIDDGQIEIQVDSVDEMVKGTVIHGGPVLSKKSVNIPGKEVGLKTPTKKDITDIMFGIKNDFDFVSASFVKSAEDVRRIRKILDEEDSEMEIIAKVEHLKAVENLDSILLESDGIMIARGDLGVEVPASDVPMLQKKIIEKCNTMEKPVITATQMLKSMTDSPRATRAEVSDVANAVMDGSDAVMLSEETAVGHYPVKSIRFMAEIIEKMENYLKGRVHHTVNQKSNDIADIISKNVWQASRDTDAKYIVAHTSSGYTGKKIAKLRPDTDIIVFTNSHMVRRQMKLVWGVKAFYMDFSEHVDEMICNSVDLLRRKDMVSEQDLLILTAGIPAPISGVTNMMEIRTVESILKEKRSLLKKEKKRRKLS
ncbi:MAG: pyruvate kinase [Candidatus Saliniplasma sp.]